MIARRIARLVPFGTLAGVGALAVYAGDPVISLLSGAGVALTGVWAIKGAQRDKGITRELRRRVRNNVKELNRVAREDRVGASQVRRLISLQSGLIQSWELLPDEYELMVAEDVFLITQEIEQMVHLARRRSALRNYLDSVNKRGLLRRIQDLERELNTLDGSSPMRSFFESTLISRRNELLAYDEVINGVGLINAQLEGAESLLSNLRGELLALDTSAPLAMESELDHLRGRVTRFRESLRDVSRTVNQLPAS